MLAGPPRSVVRSESIDQLTDGILQRLMQAAVAGHEHQQGLFECLNWTVEIRSAMIWMRERTR